MRLFWEAWLAFAHRAAGYQGIVIINAVYFCVFGPCALAARIFRARLLELDTRRRDSYWIRREPTRKRVADMARQF